MPKPAWLVNHLKDHVETNPDNLSLRYHLHKHLSGPRPGRSLYTVHASDIIDHAEEWCPRRIALMIAYGKSPPDEFLATVDSVVYTHSSDVASRMVHWLAEIGIAVTDWRCSVCGADFTFSVRPEECSCGSKSFYYREPRVTSGFSGISGGLDLLVAFPGESKAMAVEIKGVQKSDFKELKLPMALHRLRTNLYLRLIEESNYEFKDEIRTDKARILYVVKGGWGEKSNDPHEWGLPDKGWSPFKEFEIQRDDSETEPHSLLARRLKVWRDAQEAGKATDLPAGVCETSMCSLAMKCQVRSECWN